MNLKTRAKIGIAVLALAELCFFMHFKSILFLFCSVYILGFYTFYLIPASRYMYRNNIQSAKNTSAEHERNLNKMFVDSLIWPYKLIKKE